MRRETAEIVVDLFCGGGGASSGIERGGLHVDVAVNHDEAAILMHERNHRRTTHLRRSVWDVSPRAVARGRPVRLLWASPDCTHHSRALGGKPREKGIRDLAWVVVDWCRDVRPDVVMLENVPEFLDWGPLYSDDPASPDYHADPKLQRRPIPERKGEIFREFIAHLRLHGYRVEWQKLCAADYGAPTIRTRLFLIARCDGEPIVWPAPSHAKGGAGGLHPWRTAAECIDWTIPTRSIFGRRKPLADATQRRIAEGLRRYVLTAASPFLVKFYGKSTAAAVSEPMHTVTTSTGHLGLAAPSLVKFYGTATGGAPVDAPLPTVTAGGGRGGGHVAVMAPTLIQTGYGEREGQAPRALDIGAPLGTIVAGGAKHAVVSAWMAKHYGGVIGHDLDRPLGTVTTVDHHSLCTATLGPAEAEGARRVAAFLIQYYGSGGQWAKLDEPMRTIVTKARMGLVTVEIEGEPWAIVDIGLRMLTPRELARAQGFPDAYDLLEDELTLAQQIEKIGNSVCPDVPAALVRANITGASRREAA